MTEGLINICKSDDCEIMIFVIIDVFNYVINYL